MLQLFTIEEFAFYLRHMVILHNFIIYKDSYFKPLAVIVAQQERIASYRTFATSAFLMMDDDISFR